jgi:hypothetical protein
MMCETFDNGQLGELSDWLDKTPNGYVWNVEKGKLHRAKCWHIHRHVYKPKPGEKAKRKAAASIYAVKICAPTKEELLSEVPEANAAGVRCSACKP